MAYEIPLEFWQRVQDDLEEYRTTELQYTTLLRLAELANEYDFYENFSREISRVLKIGASSVSSLLDRRELDEYDLVDLNDRLLDHFAENGLAIEIDNIRRQRTQRFSMKRKDIIRANYREFEEARTALDFQQRKDSIDFPVLMLDRVELMIYSDEYMSYKKDVRAILEDSKFSFYVDIERAEYTRRDYLDAGYTAEEIDMYCPVNLDEQFSMIKNRSVLSNCQVTGKPKKVRDGSGWSMVWREDGVLYRFNYMPPAGRSVSLMLQLNMQRRVWKAILADHPGLDGVFNNEFLKESNFTPIGHEHLYVQYEKRVFDSLLQQAKTVYNKQMDLNGFKDVRSATKICRVLQSEVCWNQPLPVDPGLHLWLKYDSLRSIGLRPQLDAGTPLIVTDFYSDVDPGRVRFAHKEYQKTKKNLRSEVIFTATELKNKIDILGLHDISFTFNMKSLSDYFLEDLDLIKKYLYFKLYRRYEQINGILEHGYYDWRNQDYVISDSKVLDILKSVLDSFDDLPSWLKDVDLFSSIIDQDFLTRSFFKNLTAMQFRLRVRGDPIFRKISHGKYRLIHPAVQEFRRVRDSLVSVKKPDISELLRS
jgi:hypothetical protein